MELTTEMCQTLNDTKASLRGYARRHFMIQVVQTMLDGNASRAQRELGWSRMTLTKARKELEGGFCYIDRFHARGRKRAEEHLPDLLKDIEAIAISYSQTDPTFRTTRLYTRLTTAEVRRRLIDEKGYTDAQLPTQETIRTKLNQLGFGLRRVKKTVR